MEPVTRTLLIYALLVRGYHSASRLASVFKFLPGSKSGTTAWYCGPTRIPPPPTRTNKQYSEVLRSTTSTLLYRSDRGYAPCSSSLLKPELPSSPQLLPLPDSLFPPSCAVAPGTLLPLLDGPRPLRFPGASAFLTSIAGMTRTEPARSNC